MSGLDDLTRDYATANRNRVNLALDAEVRQHSNIAVTNRDLRITDDELHAIAEDLNF